MEIFGLGRVTAARNCGKFWVDTARTCVVGCLPASPQGVTAHKTNSDEDIQSLHSSRRTDIDKLIRSRLIRRLELLVLRWNQ